MTGRETLMAVLILVATLGAGRYIVRSSRVSVASTLFLVGASLGAILAIRTSMTIPVVAAILLMALLLSQRRGVGIERKILMVTLVVALFAAGPMVQQLTGGYGFDYMQLLNFVLTFEGNIAAMSTWSDNSIGLLLAPNNIWQALLYMLPRMILYLAAPLPNITVTISELVAGSWVAWQQLMMAPTSVLNLLALPYAMAGLDRAYKRRRIHPAPLVLHISFWITFMAIAGGNIIIHERYRIMITLLLFACAWLGYTSCSRLQVARYAFLWFSLLLIGAAFYFSYKLL